MHLVTIGANHKSAPISIREKLAVPKGLAETIIRAVCDGTCGMELAVLSTCNRVEFYIACARGRVDVELVLGRASRFLPAILEHRDRFYFYEGMEAARHLFEVTSGLDSLALGETQISRQVREAQEIACRAGGSRKVLNLLFRSALVAAKRVHTTTLIGRAKTSIGSIAAELCARKFGDLSNKMILIIGSGKIGEITLKHLMEAGARTVFVSNRTYERACELASKYGGKAARFDRLEEYLRLADIVISSTSCPHYVLTKERLQAALDGSPGRHLFIVDVAVPRDVEPSVANLANVTLYNVDQLSAVASENARHRDEEVPKCQEILEREAQKFSQKANTLGVDRLVEELIRRTEAIRDEVVAEAKSVLENLSEAEQKRVLRMIDRTVNRILHNAIENLKEEAAEGSTDEDLAQVAATLFDLDLKSPPLASTSLARHRREELTSENEESP